jgi:hypothetical protein
MDPDADNVSPGGKEPETRVQLYGGTPPEALNCCVRAIPDLADPREVVTSVKTAPMRIAKSFVAVLPAASLTRMVNWNVPGLVGVPLICAEFKLNPGGREPPETAQV